MRGEGEGGGELASEGAGDGEGAPQIRLLPRGRTCEAVKMSSRSTRQMKGEGDSENAEGGTDDGDGGTEAPPRPSAKAAG